MPDIKPLGLITFDIDDTLYSSTDFARGARANALKAMIQAGLNIEFEAAAAELDEIVSEFTSNDASHFDRLLQRLPLSALSGINPPLLVAAGIVAYRDSVHNALQVYEDALEALKRLYTAGFRLGIVSQGITIKQAEKLVRLKILPYIDKRAVFFTEQFGTSKSNPKFYQRISQKLNIEPAACMHVGDRPDRDIDPPNSAGWITVLNRRSGRYHERPGLTPPAYSIQNFWDLIDIVERNFKKGN